MDHDIELIIPILEILEIEVFNILYKPGNIGNMSFSTSSYPGNIGKRIFSTSSYPGNIGSYDPYLPILEILDRTIHISVLSGCVYNLCFAVEPPRRGFFSAKNNISLIFGHVLSQEIALFPGFGPYLALFEPY